LLRNIPFILRLMTLFLLAAAAAAAAAATTGSLYLAVLMRNTASLLPLNLFANITLQKIAALCYFVSRAACMD
jgi:hypothetical protein